MVDESQALQPVPHGFLFGLAEDFPDAAPFDVKFGTGAAADRDAERLARFMMAAIDGAPVLR